MSDSIRGRGLHRIRNKVLAVLVAMAVLPAVAVSIYALRKTSDALSEQALTLISESCVTDARRAGDLLAGVEQQLVALVKGNNDATQLLRQFVPDEDSQQSGERETIEDSKWKAVQRDLNAVDQKLRRLLEEQPSCLLALVSSPGFGAPEGTPILWVARDDGKRPLQSLVERDRSGYLRPLPPPADPLLPRLAEKFSEVRDQHPERDLLRATVIRPAPDEDDAVELFAARVQGSQGTEFGWIFLVHSWRLLLRELHEHEAIAEDRTLLSIFDARKLAPLATSQPGRFVRLPEEFGLRDHARSLHANAALFESGEVVAFAPLLPRGNDASLAYVLASERPASGLLASVRRFQIVFTAVLAGALLLATLVGLWFARRLTRPLEVLRDGAIRIGRGELTQTIEVATGDEAEELAHEFNAMAGELRSLYAGMEQTIRERTEQLQTALDGLRVAHDRIVDSEKRYSDIVENASDLIQVTDAEGRIVSANRRQAERLCAPGEELRGRSFFDLVAPEARTATQRAFAQVLAGGSLRAFDSELMGNGNAPRFPVEISATPIIEAGRAVGVRAILRDVSERKAFEARLIKAERLSSVGALAAGVAHEINNPMGIITMFAQRTLERAKKGELDIAKLEKIVEQGKRVAAITRNLLDFARAAPTRFAPFAIGDVVQSTCALVADRVQMASITLAVDIAPGLPPVMGNGQQIGQVVLNLLLNSIQALGKEGRITVRAESIESGRLPTGGRALRVTVEDDGPGIAAEALPHLFEPFFTTKAPGEGTGLGLSVSWGIVKDHHGAIFARNRPEGGACFELELPLEAALAMSDESKRPNLPSASPTAPAPAKNESES